MPSNQSREQGQRWEKQRKTRKKKPLNRNNPDKQAVSEAWFRLSKTADGKICLDDIDYIVSTLKTTPHTDDGQIKPDPVACHWQAAILWLRHNIHKRIEEGSGKPKNEYDQEYEETYDDPRNIMGND